MKVGYVVLYVEDSAACRSFWVDRVGMVEKKRTVVGDVAVVKVGFADQAFAFELVPLYPFGEVRRDMSGRGRVPLFRRGARWAESPRRCAPSGRRALTD